MNFEQFRNNLAQRNVFVSEEMLNQLKEYMFFLIEYNQKVNLTSIVEPSEIIAKHFYDSVVGFLDLDLDYKCLADVGSGAGFPGMVLKIIFPKLKVTLIEPTLKRCIFLNEVKNKLKLQELEILNERAESLEKYRGTFDFVSGRAVSSFSILLELGSFLLKPKGIIILLRAKNGIQEYDDARGAVKTLNLKLIKSFSEEYEGNTRNIFYLELQKLVAKKYPRNYSLIKSKPL